jgi:hypothetical protein
MKKTYFPLLICNGEKKEIYSPSDLPSGVPFKVIRCNLEKKDA